MHSPSDHTSRPITPITPITPIAPIAPTPKSNRSNRCNRSNIPTSRPPPSSTSPLPRSRSPHATPSCSQLADTRPVACSRYAPRRAPFSERAGARTQPPKNALGKNAKAPSVRTLRRSQYERQTALGKNAKALSVRASEPPSDRGMQGVTSPNATLYLSASRGKLATRGDRLPHIHYLWGDVACPTPR